MNLFSSAKICQLSLYRKDLFSSQDEDELSHKTSRPLLGSQAGKEEVIDGAEWTQVGSDVEKPKQLLGFIPEIETISLLMKYEKIWASFCVLATDSSTYLEQELGIPFPFNYIVFVLSTIVSLYLSTYLKTLLCKKKNKETHVFNNIDAVDLGKIMKLLEKIEGQGKGQIKVSNYQLYF